MANQVARVVVRCEEANETQILGKTLQQNFNFCLTDAAIRPRHPIQSVDQ